MRIFISAGEPSGDLHGSNLIREFRLARPDIEFVGFGGQKMQSAGCRLLYPLCDLAVMWLVAVITNIRTFYRLVTQAHDYFRDEKPDAVILIDFPGFHWHIARCAHKHGIPVYYFVPPQLWAWAGWRVKKMRRWVREVLAALPFEADWYNAQGMPAHFVGHPYFDELPRQQLDGAFMAEQTATPGPRVGLLPGSRRQEIHANWPTLRESAFHILAAQPKTRFLVAAFNEAQAALIREDLSRYPLLLTHGIDVHVGRTPEVIESSEACIAVSGSVGLELLYRKKPTVVVYRVGQLGKLAAWVFKKVPYISLVNLLAGKELFPEYLTTHNPAQSVAGHVLGWLQKPHTANELRGELADLCDQVAQSGACQRAAQHILAQLVGTRPASQAA